MIERRIEGKMEREKEVVREREKEGVRQREREKVRQRERERERERCWMCELINCNKTLETEVGREFYFPYN